MQKVKALIYNAGYPVMQIYWFFRRPITHGVRCVITYNNKTLLVKHTYGSRLRTAVGGGIEKDETPTEAVVREVYEEVGLTLKNVVQVGSISYKEEYKNDTIFVFSAIAEDNNLKIDRSEIKEADWFDPDNIPSDTSPLFIKFFSLAKPYLQQD